MIVSGLLELFLSIIGGAFEGLNFVGLPADAINVLSDILMYGIWVIGADLFSIFLSCIVFWWGLKFTIGIVIWIWELLPLT